MLDKSKKVCYNIKAVRDDTPLKLNNPCAEVVEWQTRYFEGVVEIFPCGFKSHSPHQTAIIRTPSKSMECSDYFFLKEMPDLLLGKSGI